MSPETETSELLPPPTKITLPIVGFYFRPMFAKEHLRGMIDGDEIVLITEPDNQYDKNAIMVLNDGVHLGYVGKDSTGVLHEYMKQHGVEQLRGTFLRQTKGPAFELSLPA